MTCKTKMIQCDVQTYAPGGGDTSTQYSMPIKYRMGREAIDVLLWHRWPSYDFIFGVPAKTNKYRKEEVAFFQYRDVRAKKVKCGFYVDTEELEILLRGFIKLGAHNTRRLARERKS